MLHQEVSSISLFSCKFCHSGVAIIYLRQNRQSLGIYMFQKMNGKSFECCTLERVCILHACCVKTISSKCIQIKCLVLWSRREVVKKRMKKKKKKNEQQAWNAFIHNANGQHIWFLLVHFTRVVLSKRIVLSVCATKHNNKKECKYDRQRKRGVKGDR